MRENTIPTDAVVVSGFDDVDRWSVLLICFEECWMISKDDEDAQVLLKVLYL